MKGRSLEQKEMLKGQAFHKHSMASKIKSFFVKDGAYLTIGAMLIGTSLGLASCGDKNNTSSTESKPPYSTTTSSFDYPSSSDLPNSSTIDSEVVDSKIDNQKPDEGITEEKTTLEELLSEYSEIANNFASTNIDKISYIDNALSTSFSYQTNEDGQITSVIVANVVKTGETTRELKIATIDFSNPIEIQDLIDGNVEETMVVIDSQSVLSFDAKEEYKNEDSTIQTQIDEIIENQLGETKIEIADYESETFIPTTVAQLVEEYGDKVNEILNETCFDKISKRCILLDYDVNNIQLAKWVLKGETEILEVGMLIKYKEKSGNVTYIFGRAKFKKDVSIQDFINKDNIEIQKVTRDFSYVHDESVQGTRDELVNSIFEAYGMSKECPEGAIRLFVDNGDTLDNSVGESHQFIVCEISKDKITKFKIRIKDSSSDNEFINNLKSGKFAIYEEEKVDVSGEKVEWSLANTQ